MFVFNQTTGYLLRDTRFVAAGYSGHGIGRNNPVFQRVHNVGPIPEGFYAIGKPYDTDTHGPYVMRLTPAPETDTWGRDGFLCHGNNAANDASQGCLIAPRLTREYMWSSGDHLLNVISGLAARPAAVSDNGKMTVKET